MVIRLKALGLAMVAALLLRYEATAAPMASRLLGVPALSGNVAQAVLGSEQREARRTERHVHRYERRSERYVHRQMRRGERYAHRQVRRDIRRDYY